MIVEPTIHEKDNPLKVSNLIQSITPYAPGKPISEMKREYGMAHVTKLASNECPIPISEGLKSIVTQSANEIHRYPDPGCYDLKISFAKYFQVDPRWIMVGNGSNELIDLLVRTYCEPNQDYILTSKAAFLAYNLCAQAARIRSFETDLTEDFKFDLNKFKEVLKSPEGKKVRLVFIANPNNPTGTYINSNELKSFLDFCHPIENLLVVIDEAYFEFVQAQDYNTSMNWLEEYPQLVVLRTMSKAFSLAGLRVGAMVARPEILDFVNRIRNPFNVSLVAQNASIYALNETERLKQVCELTWNGLNYFYDQLNQLQLPYVKSQGNFVLFDTKEPALEVYNKLLKLGVILRPVLNYGFKTHLRMSVGTETENETAISALKTVLKD